MQVYQKQSQWKTTKSVGVDCASCGKKGTCTVSPDGKAFKCWKDGGRIHQTGAPGGTFGTGYVGKAHRNKLKQSPAHATCDDAIAMAGKTVRGTLAYVWHYTDREGRDVMRVARFDLEDGSKQFRPVHFAGDGWHVGDPAGKLPLYRLANLPDSGEVHICEGEKATDAAVAIGLAAMTSAHGSSSAHKTDWKPLAGRDVVIYPDNDDAGEGYACDVARLMAELDPPARCKIVRLPGLPDGGDMVEFVQAGGTLADVEHVAGVAVWISREDIVGGPVLVCLADVEPTEIDWLWPGRIALGRITLLVGKPGEGKSFLTCDWASRVSTGTRWPDGADCPRGSVLLMTAEDDPGDTIRPRLDAHDADVNRIHILAAIKRPTDDGSLQEVMVSLADIAAITDAVKRTRPLLIVIDPIGSFLGGSTDAHRDNEVRAVLAPVARIAAEYGAAVVIVMHRRKASGSGAGGADEMAMGSRAFSGIARAVWHVSRDPDNKQRRFLLPGKNNLAPEGDGLGFTIAGNPPAIAYERDPVRQSADDALSAELCGSGSSPGPSPDVRDMASAWLRGELSDLEEHTVASVKASAESAGVGSWKTVQRAAEVIGVISHRATFGGGYVWRLPKPAPMQVTIPANALTCPPVSLGK